MTDTAVDSFFDDAVRSGAPSAAFKTKGDFVLGEIVDQYQIEATDFATGEVITDKKTGATVMQLVVVLQTDKRNWEGVARIPRIDPNDRNSAEKPGSEDDGKRAIYVRKFTNLHAAIGKAVAAATGKAGPLRNGGRLGVEFFKDEDRGKGNPLKHYRAKYEPPVESAGGAFFDGASSSASESAPASSQPQGGGREVTDEPPF